MTKGKGRSRSYFKYSFVLHVRRSGKGSGDETGLVARQSGGNESYPGKGRRRGKRDRKAFYPTQGEVKEEKRN